MLSLLRLFWPLCQLQRGPQDLPADPALLGQNVLLCLLTGLLSFSLSMPFGEALIRAVVSIAISFAIWVVLLRQLAPAGRQLQTLIAIYGCAVILNLLLLPVLWLLEASGEHPGFLPWLLLALLVWSQLVNGNILRHTLEWSLAAGVALALGIFILRQSLFSVIFG
jgi:hypothetical protein